MKRVALLAVGSFNPPTMAHLRMLEVARSYLETERDAHVVEGIMSPVADSYNKKSTVVSASHRFEMVHAATKSSTWIRADNWECTRDTWTRTLAVLTHHKEEVRRKFGDDVGLMLVVGGDVVDSFPRVLPDGSNLWNVADILEIITEFGLIVLTRENAKPLDTVRSMSALSKHADKIMMVSDEVCPNKVSSTRLRSALAKNQSIKYTTPDEVIAYIAKNELYQN